MRWILVLLAACAAQPQQPPSTTTTVTMKSTDGIAKSTSCTKGELTYLGFRGTGSPPKALYDAIKARFPDVMVYEIKDGNLGVFTAEHHSWDVRGRHEAAAATVGWKGDVVDFASVEADCTATFHTPMPPP